VEICHKLREVSFDYRFRSIALEIRFDPRVVSTRTERIYSSGKQIFNYNNNVDLQKNRLQRLYLVMRVAVTHGNGKKDTRKKMEVSQQRERRERKRERERDKERHR